MRPFHISAVLDREFNSTAAAAQTPVMLWGPPGIGKSRIVAQIAEANGVPLIDLRLWLVKGKAVVPWGERIQLV
jgi:replication-associated recombination protein RarA